MGRSWAAQPRQNRFLVDFEHVYEAFYGGSAGGGKTDALLIFQAQRRMTYPGSTGLFLRRRFTDLSQPGAALDRLKELFYGVVNYNANEHTATWPNGSVTKFGYMDSEEDRHQYHGSQPDDITFDEVTQFTERMYSYMFSRARVTNPALAAMGMKSKIRSAGNPGGIGHAYFKDRFVDRCREQVYVDPDIFLDLPGGVRLQPDRVFVPARVDDNHALMASDPMYKLNLMMLPEADRRALLDGDWDVFEGQFFTEWRREVHVVDPVVPPPHWRRWLGFDWGYAAPWVCLWFAQDPDTRQVVVYREASGRRMHDSEIARTILELSGNERITTMYADPSIWAKKNDTSTADIIEKFRGWKIPLEPASNDRKDGWRRVHEYLAWEPDGTGGVAVSPLLKVGANCRDLIRTLPMQIHDALNVEDLDTDGDDHWVDPLRYGLHSRPVIHLGKRGRTSYALLPR